MLYLHQYCNSFFLFFILSKTTQKAKFNPISRLVWMEFRSCIFCIWPPSLYISDLWMTQSALTKIHFPAKYHLADTNLLFPVILYGTSNCCLQEFELRKKQIGVVKWDREEQGICQHSVISKFSIYMSLAFQRHN